MGLKRRTMRPSWYLTSVVVLLMFQCLTLGGDDFDKRIVDWLAANFKRDEGIDLLKDKQALQRLTETAEKAKMELSTLTQTSISLPFITATADGPKHIETTITRAKFEELCSDLLDRLRTPVENSLRDAKLSFKDLDEVILVGGSTRIPAIQELVKKLTGKDPNVTIRAGLGGEMRILCFVLKFKILCFNIIIVLRFEKSVLKFEKVELFIIFCIDI